MFTQAQKYQSQFHLPSLNYGATPTEIELGIPQAAMFQPIGDDAVSTIPDDASQTEMSQSNNMKH